MKNGLISDFLCSKQHYKDYFDTHSGTYWYSQSWLENTPNKDDVFINKLRKKYEEKDFDEDAIEFLLETETSWIKNYSNAAFIRIPEVIPKSEDSACREEVNKIAKNFGWNYDELTGDIFLLRDFLEGNWREDAFLVIPPGKIVEPSHDDNIIKAGSQN